MDDDALRIWRARLAELLASVEQGEVELRSIHAALSARIIAKIRELPSNTNMSSEQLRIIFADEIAKTLPSRARIIRGTIETGAKLGPKAARQTFREVFGEQTTDAQVRGTAAAMREAGERIAGRVTIDNVGLTKRLRGVDSEIAQQMSVEVRNGIVQRKGILGAARKIEALDPREVKLPGYLAELEDAARRGSVEDVKALAKSYAKRIAKMGEVQVDGTMKASKYSLRSATKKFVQDVQNSSADGVDGIVRDYIEKKAAWRANLIARHESAEAFRSSYVAQARNKVGCWGFKWTLSTRHASLHKPGTPMDVCDLYANQNAYGLGAGVYPPDKVPHAPHPLCICSSHALIRRDAFDVPEEERNQPPASARQDKAPDAVGWLRQNDAAAARILGPTRHALFKDGRRVLTPTGAPALVRDLLGNRRAAE